MNYEERHHKYFPRPYCSCGESVVALDAAAVTNSVPSAVVKSSAALNAFTAVVVDVVAVCASDVLKCFFFNAIRY